MTTEFPCLGFHFLGMCSYNPAQPSPSYFTIGDAIAALAFTIAVQQILKPIHSFRLAVAGLNLKYIFLVVFFGAAFTIIAALVPNFPVGRTTFLSYPVFWEILAGILFALCYISIVFISLRPASISERNVDRFCLAGAQLLSSATNEDRIAFAKDFLSGKNLEKLIDYTLEIDRAERHAVGIEFERLRSIGAEMRIRGRLPTSAFYQFSHRQELNRAYYAATLLNILSEQDFCRTLVSHLPWLTASAIHDISKMRKTSDSIKTFVQSIAIQALLADDSMISKETHYIGFGTTRELSTCLFGNPETLRLFEPLNGYFYSIPEIPSNNFVRRVNLASELTIQAAIKRGDFWDANYMHGNARIYESLGHQWSHNRYNSLKTDFHREFSRGVGSMAEFLNSALDNNTISPKQKESLFTTENQREFGNLVSIVADIVFEALCSVANKFGGFEDYEAWSIAIDIHRKIFCPFGDDHEGLNPLQQKIAIKLINRLRDNLKGYYPSISRILFAVIGPYDQPGHSEKNTPEKILRDAFYNEINSFSKFFADKPEQYAQFFPPNVVYDPNDNAFIHTYNGGQTGTTKMNELAITNVDLFDRKNWQL